jgi:hypothetical protein
MWESGRIPVLVKDRMNAKKLLDLLADSGMSSLENLDWRNFTLGYTSFDEAYPQG